MYKYCPYCKSDLTKKDFEYTCPNGHKVYINPAPCVSIIPIKDNKILLTKRGIEPKKGTIDVVGGFIQVGETTEDAAIRETQEETGLNVKIRDYLGQYTETDYTPGVTYPMAFVYTVEIIGGELKPQDDVSELFWVELDKIDELDFTGSFKTIRPTLEKVRDFYSRGLQKS